jgi:hypothetical protein
MHAVVNHLPIKPDANWAELQAKFGAFETATLKQYPALKGMGLIRASDTEAIVLVVYADREGLEHVSKNVAGPWFAENVRPYLSGPTTRAIGEIVAGTLGR